MAKDGSEVTNRPLPSLSANNSQASASVKASTSKKVLPEDQSKNAVLLKTPTVTQNTSSRLLMSRKPEEIGKAPPRKKGEDRKSR
ncbi:hypothetical protein ILUMI_00010 [Ignelater luminosus]|uniref:Uncharacterized protein n=1 Tax=Ignelater luminosus TaxID=2038154 RepID=A0A8K0DMP2_IGNLU|nr:hypothetical protein ILUMI_00010 [Ignelater luminosus]